MHRPTQLPVFYSNYSHLTSHRLPIVTYLDALEGEIEFGSSLHPLGSIFVSTRFMDPGTIEGRRGAHEVQLKFCENAEEYEDECDDVEEG